MKYLTKHLTLAAYNQAKDSFYKPHVAWVEEGGSVEFQQSCHKSYLTFIAREQGTFTLNIGANVPTSLLQSVSYSLDDGETWTTTNNQNNTAVTITTPTINSGCKVLWKGIGIGVSTTLDLNNRPSTSSIFSSTGKFDIEGNILSLVCGDNFVGKNYVAEGSTYNFALLFYGSAMNEYAKVVSAKNMCLPINNTTDFCYARMFQGNTSLVIPPSIYGNSMGEYCCAFMFQGCTSLTTAPELPAMTMYNYCYNNMFRDCTSLVTAPELPATTLAQSCYKSMFQNCSSLAVSPELPATTLAALCYADMFFGCTSLTTAPSLPANTLAESCYHEMFRGCTSLTTAPVLPATTLALGCYNYMFNGCSSLNYIKAAFTTEPSTTYTNSWLSGVAASGTFYKNSAAKWTTTGVQGIPTGWTVQTYTP